MLKTISAALLAVSVLAAPAFAAGEAKTALKTAQTPVTKSAQAPVAKTTDKTTQAPVIKAEQAKVKPSALNANARMGRHHVRHVSHHRFHKHVGAIKTHKFSKVSAKHITPAVKRG
jgi:hypothetical protein